MDWAAINIAARQGGLLAYLVANVMREQWRTARAPGGRTLLHYAAMHGDPVVAVLLRSGMDAAVLNDSGQSALHEAAANGHAGTLALLIAAAFRARNVRTLSSFTPLGYALYFQHGACARVLLENGARLHLCRSFSDAFAPWMAALELGVQRCRAVAMVLLGVKRRRVRALLHYDKFVVALLALDVWMTRADDEWQRL